MTPQTYAYTFAIYRSDRGFSASREYIGSVTVEAFDEVIDDLRSRS